MKTALISGITGQDGSYLTELLLDKGYEVECVSFDYGQKHKKELACATRICQDLSIPLHLIDLNVLKRFFSSSLTDDSKAVPEGHYEAENMKSVCGAGRNRFF